MKYIFVFVLIAINCFAFDAFIKPEKLKSIINNNNLIIVDVDSYALYKKSHIKNAIYFDLKKIIPKKENPYMLFASTKTVQKYLRDLGINTDSDIVIYSHNTTQGILNSSYLAFVLIYNGVKNVSILDGGYLSWVFQNELLSSSIAGYAHARGNFVFKENQSFLINIEDVEQNLEDMTIMDSRSPGEYYGVTKSRGINDIGHIPHAKSSFYKYIFLSDDTIRSDEELKQIYIDGFGLDKNSKIIVYGNCIFDASALWYVLYQKMGFKNTKLYGASLKEWGNNPAMSMQKFKWE